MRVPPSIQLAAVALVPILLAGCAAKNPPSAMKQEESSMMKVEENAMLRAASHANPQTMQEKIDNAMSAAPANIAAAAAVLDWPSTENGNLAEIRAGTNGWSCLPDYPASPGNDPICVDENAMLWFKAYMGKENPAITQSGIGYMLQGGSDASNTDPFAMEPAAGEDWMNAPAHIMVFPSGDLDPAVYGTNMDGGPWIMWSGTPYEHLMIPVQ